MDQRYERYPVSCEIDGDVFNGKYWIAGRILVVSTAVGGTSRQLANQQPEDLAKVLLRNFVLANRESMLATGGRENRPDRRGISDVTPRQGAGPVAITTDPNTVPHRYGKS